MPGDENMNRRQKAIFIRKTLDRLFPRVDVTLGHDTPFTLLVAVILSAQSTDRMVNSVTPELFKLARTPAAMARLPVATIARIIRPCGLAPTKARNLKAMARLLLARHRGRVPRSFETLEALPGVGHKTASVVMGFAFQMPAFPVDTHIHRLARRWGLSSGASVERTERDLKALFPPALWMRLHLQIIFFGREYCPARNHDYGRCPICRRVAKRPRKEKK